MEKLGALEYVGRMTDKSDIAAVILHGYGAHAFDLFGLADELDPQGQISWYFLNAPLEVSFDMGFSGRAWYPLEPDDMQRFYAGKTLEEEVENPRFRQSHNQVLDFISRLRRPNSQILLGGFSQGAIVSTAVQLELKDPLAGLLLFSGSLLYRKLWAQKLLSAGRPAFFQSHGRSDTMLPFAYAEKLYNLLTQAGWQGSWHPFNGAHEIPRPVMYAARGFLESVTSPRV